MALGKALRLWGSWDTSDHGDPAWGRTVGPGQMIARLFTYGTLRDPTVLRQVLGPGIAALPEELGAEAIPGFTVFETDQGYPMLFPQGPAIGYTWAMPCVGSGGGTAVS